MNRMTRWPTPKKAGAASGPVNGDFASYVEQLTQAAAVRSAAGPERDPLDSGDWGRDAFELDELSARAGKKAVSAQTIVARSPLVSADLSLPKGVRQQVERVREKARQELQAVAAGRGKPAASAGRTPSGPAQAAGGRQPDLARRQHVRTLWFYVKWGLFVLFVLPWLVTLLITLLRS